jgi:hypothetical protein
MFLWRENSGGFHAQVVVLNHPTGFGFKSKEDLCLAKTSYTRKMNDLAQS